MGKDLKGKELGTGIRQRKDGRYEARALVKGIEINLYGLNLKELKKDFEQAKEQAKQNVDVRWNNITLNEWFEEWFTKYKVPVIKETSIFPMKSKYYNTFGKILGDKKIVDILNIDIQEAINTMHEQGRASSSMREALGRVRECMESAKRNKIIAENPCFEISVPWENKSKERRFLTKEEQTLFLKTVENNWYKEMLYIMFLTGMRVGDDDDKIRLNQRKPSKYKGLSRFGPEKNLQRINKFMKERPIFYKNLIQMKENFRFYLRCFYCITKVVILQFNSENRTELARNG